MKIQIDLLSEIPIYKQIRDQIVLAIARGDLKNGDVLPSVRNLALDLGINHMTVNKAYNVLKQEAYIVTDRSKGTRIRTEKKDLPSLSKAYEESLGLILAEGLARASSTEEFRSLVEDLLDKMIKERNKK